MVSCGRRSEAEQGWKTCDGFEDVKSMQVRHLMSLKRTGPKKGDRPALRMALHVSNCTGQAQGVPFDVRRQRFFWLDDGPLHVYRDPFTQRTREEGRRRRGLLKEHYVPMAWFLTALWNKMMGVLSQKKEIIFFLNIAHGCPSY